jgi:hypothetical protein
MILATIRNHVSGQREALHRPLPEEVSHLAFGDLVVRFED